MKKGLGFGLILILALLWGVTIWARSVPQVAVYRVQSEVVTVSVVSSGIIAEENAVSVQTEIPVVIQSICVRAGDSVKKGDLLAVVDRKKTVELLKERYSDPLTALASSEDWTEMLSSANAADWLPNTVSAPVDGTVSRICVPEHGLSCDVARISVGGGKYIRLHIPEDQIGMVTVGQTARVEGVGFTEPHIGTVDRIAPEATSENSVIGVDVWISVDGGSEFRSGFSTTVTIETDQTEQIWTVPSECVAIDTQCTEYIQISENGRVRNQSVEVLQEENGRCRLNAGVSDGMLVLLRRTEAGRLIRPEITQ